MQAELQMLNFDREYLVVKLTLVESPLMFFNALPQPQYLYELYHELKSALKMGFLKILRIVCFEVSIFRKLILNSLSTFYPELRNLISSVKNKVYCF